MNVKLFSTGTLAVAGAVVTSTLAFPVATAWADEDALKRDEDTADVVLVDDDDDDDDATNDDTDATTAGETATNDDTVTNTGNTNTGTGTNTGDQDDVTNSVDTAASRDQDVSRSDLTRDMTQDGPGDRKRDLSQNHTNDASRNDTRA